MVLHRNHCVNSNGARHVFNLQGSSGKVRTRRMGLCDSRLDCRARQLRRVASANCHGRIARCPSQTQASAIFLGACCHDHNFGSRRVGHCNRNRLQSCGSLPVASPAVCPSAACSPQCGAKVPHAIAMLAACPSAVSESTLRAIALHAIARWAARPSAASATAQWFTVAGASGRISGNSSKRESRHAQATHQ
jgi:hypothetical protein